MFGINKRLDDLTKRLAGIGSTISDQSVAIGSVQTNIRQAIRVMQDVATKMEAFMSAAGDQISQIRSEVADIKTTDASLLQLAQGNHDDLTVALQKVTALQAQINQGQPVDLSDVIADLGTIRDNERQAVTLLAGPPPQLPNQPDTATPASKDALADTTAPASSG